MGTFMRGGAYSSPSLFQTCWQVVTDSSLSLSYVDGLFQSSTTMGVLFSCVGGMRVVTFVLEWIRPPIHSHIILSCVMYYLIQRGFTERQFEHDVMLIVQLFSMQSRNQSGSSLRAWHVPDLWNAIDVPAFHSPHTKKESWMTRREKKKICFKWLLQRNAFQMRNVFMWICIILVKRVPRLYFHWVQSHLMGH